MAGLDNPLSYIRGVALVLSPNCRVVCRTDGVAAFHRIFGNLTLLTHREHDMMSSFVDGRVVDPDCLDESDRRLIAGLLARKFLVPRNSDEWAEIAADADRRQERAHTGYLVRGLQLVVSNECNFRCKYCFVRNMYNSEDRSRLQVDPENQKMSFAVASAAMDKTLALLKRNGHSELFVEFFGGEPLMNWPLVRRVLEEYKHGRPGEPCIKYSITTNGSLVTAEMAEVFRAHNVTVTLSFDSPKNVERIAVSGSNARLLVQKSIEVLNAHGNWITFNSVLSKETLHTFDGRSLVDFAVENGVKMIGLILDLDLSFYTDSENRRIVVKKILDTYAYGQSRDLPIVGYWYQIFAQIAGLQHLNFQKGFKTCPAEGCKISVEPGGDIFICKCCSGRLGHLDSFADVFNTSLYREYAAKAYRAGAECAGCDLENFCSGVCMGALEKQNGSLWGRQTSSCEVFRELTRDLIGLVQAPNQVRAVATRTGSEDVSSTTQISVATQG